MSGLEEPLDQFERFKSRLIGDVSEDLTKIFTHVRLQAKAGTRANWATRWETRRFCDLGLDLLYRRHFYGARSVEAHTDGVLFPHLRPEDIVKHANTVIRDPAEAEALSKQRWADIWSHQSNYIEDLIAYLFRPGPYIVRIRESQLVLTKMLASGMSLGALVRAGVGVEIESNMNDPLVALQTFVQTALPTNPLIRGYANRLDEETIRQWSQLYEIVFPAYGLTLEAGYGWSDVARTFTVVADGVLMRARIRDNDDLERITNGDDVLSTVIIGLLPMFFTVRADEINDLRRTQ